MARDEHLGTGEYDPETYWNARARSSEGSVYRAVCGFKIGEARNAAMDAVQRRVLERLLVGIPLEGADVLDLGCGVGRMSGFFTDRGASYTGADVAEEMLRIAREAQPALSFHKLESAALPFPDTTFDLACTITVLHHNPHERQAELISELLRVLRPGGHLVLMESIRRSDQRGFNVYPRSVAEWIAAVTEVGGVDLVRTQGSRWSMLRDTAEAVARKLRRTRGGQGASALPAALDGALVRLGRVVDPALLPLLPWRYAANAGLCFRKRP